MINDLLDWKTKGQISEISYPMSLNKELLGLNLHTELSDFSPLKQFNHFPGVWLWTNSTASLNFDFLLCKIEMYILPFVVV